MGVWVIVVAVLLLLSVLLAVINGEWKNPTYLVWLAIAVTWASTAKLPPL